MEMNQLAQQADKLIRRVVNKYNTLYAPSGEISQVDLDLLLDDLRHLYDTFKNISYQNSALVQKPVVPMPKPESQMPANAAFSTNEKSVEAQKNLPETPQKASTTAAEPTPNQETKKIVYTLPSEPEIETETDIESEIEEIDKVEEKMYEEPENNSDFVSETIENTTENQPPVFTTQNQTLEEEISATTNQTIIADETTASKPTTIADSFRSPEKSVSEFLAEKNSQILGSRVLIQPISDLVTAIGLNDKFSFISELFNNNATAYDEAITRINRAVNFDEGMWILQSYHTTEWEINKETGNRLKDFVKRRFI